MAYFPTYDYFVTCAPGFESLLAGELRNLRCRSVRPQRSGVMFKGTVKDGYRVCMWSRFGSRVLMTLLTVDADSDAHFYEGIKEFAWEQHLQPTGTLYIESVGANDVFRNTQFINVRTKDAIVDRLRDKRGKRPSIEAVKPDVRLNVALYKNEAKIALDLSGEPLHRRYYRPDGVQVLAPMKETLAAAMLTWAGWPRIAAQGAPFVDFMCGSATLPIEAAMIAGDIAPGLMRRNWGFSRWIGHDKAAWDALLDEAKNRRAAGLERIPPILASDHDALSVSIAARGLRRVELDRYISLKQADFSDVRPPDGCSAGLIAINPPYGKRMLEKGELPAFYAPLREALHEHWGGWKLAVITPDQSISVRLGLKPQNTHPVRNGPIDAEILTYHINKK
jgi:23S rRNA (guanine2445-N2)-methyltransferase / 23S rRNA (guanine2069-N7)-methyltransferase